MDLHPVAVATLQAIAASGQKPYHDDTPQAARENVAARLRALPPRPHPGIARIVDLSIEGPAGPMACRRYDPVAPSGPGTIVYAHGGGWVLGAPDLFDPLCSWLAAAAGRTLVSVDYRLAPETPFPGAAEDIAAAVAAVRDGPTSVVVAGDSAGGNLAAAAALMLRDRGDDSLAGQLMLYPVLDHDFTTESYRTLGDAGRIISTADMRWFWDQYAPDEENRAHRYASPLRAPDLAGLPPAYIAVAGWDPLHDEGVAFARRLVDAEVAVELDDLGDMIHGFCSQAGMLDRADQTLLRAGLLAAKWLDREKSAAGTE
ncbi:alpha/beta hydrolase [soil metagenome]